MHHESDLKQESGDERMAIADEREPRQDKKPWVTPVVSESPVNELTASSFVGTGVDNMIYS